LWTEEDERLKFEIIEYCVKDVQVLKECVDKMVIWLKERLGMDMNFISTAGMALRYFTMQFFPKDQNSIPKGIVHTFKLEYNSSFSERILSEDVVFEVLSSGNKLQNGEHDKASILNLVTQKDGMLISMRADTREHTLIGNEVLKKHRGTFYIENNFEPTKKMNIENFKRIFKFITPLPNSIIVR
jgi:hypothetical protein